MDERHRLNRTIVAENLPIVGLIGTYIVVGYILQAALNVPDMMQIHFLPRLLGGLAAVVSLLYLNLQVMRKRTRMYCNRASAVGFLILLLILSPFKSAFASIKQVIPLIHDFEFDATWMKLDQWLHFGHHPWEWLRFVLDHEASLRYVDRLYMVWFLLLLFISLFMGWSSRRKLRLQYILTTLLVWMFLGSVLGTTLSSAGPCYFGEVVPGVENPYEPMMARLHALHESDKVFAVHNQVALWEAKEHNEWLPFGGVSAMPSVHVGMAVVFALLAWQLHRAFGVVMILYAIATQIGSVILGWHYAVDGYVSALLTFSLWLLVGKFVERLTDVPERIDELIRVHTEENVRDLAGAGPGAANENT